MLIPEPGEMITPDRKCWYCGRIDCTLAHDTDPAMTYTEWLSAQDPEYQQRILLRVDL